LKRLVTVSALTAFALGCSSTPHPDEPVGGLPAGWRLDGGDLVYQPSRLRFPAEVAGAARGAPGRDAELAAEWIDYEAPQLQLRSRAIFRSATTIESFVPVADFAAILEGFQREQPAGTVERTAALSIPFQEAEEERGCFAALRWTSEGRERAASIFTFTTLGHVVTVRTVYTPATEQARAEAFAISAALIHLFAPTQNRREAGGSSNPELVVLEQPCSSAKAAP